MALYLVGQLLEKLVNPSGSIRARIDQMIICENVGVDQITFGFS